MCTASKIVAPGLFFTIGIIGFFASILMVIYFFISILAVFIFFHVLQLVVDSYSYFGVFDFNSGFQNQLYVPGQYFYVGFILLVASVDVILTAKMNASNFHLWPAFLVTAGGLYLFYLEVSGSVTFYESLKSQSLSLASDDEYKADLNFPVYVNWALGTVIADCIAALFNGMMFLFVFLGLFLPSCVPFAGYTVADIHFLNMSEMVPSALIHDLGIICTILAILTVNHFYTSIL